jgi:lysophospholipase L1-like esterase
MTWSPATAVAVVSLLASVIGCAGGPSESRDPAESSVPPVATVSAGVATPAIPATPTFEPTAGPNLVPPTVVGFEPPAGATETWHLVALGDSNVAGWGINKEVPFSPEDAYPGVYAALLAEEQGVEVVLHSYYPSQLGNEVRTVAEWADVLAIDESMRRDLARADIVTILIGYHDIIPIMMFGQCGQEWPELRACLEDATGPMPAAFDRLYADLRSLVSPAAIILVNDYGIPGPLYERWSTAAFWPELRQAMFEGWRDALEAAAVEHGFRVVHTYAAMNATGGAPLRDWNTITSDGWHFNAVGHRLIAELVLAEDGID